jgi:alanyl-tRNA synthetase
LKDIHPGINVPLGSNRIVTSQPCIRTNDIDEVGDQGHLTMFEMLGNFSFKGSYFKKEAIEFACEWMFGVLKLDQKEMYVTVYTGDEKAPFDQECYDLWISKGFTEEQIIRTIEDNFWGPVGNEGPCGPCTEIFFKGLEIWNLVFNQYYKKADGSFIPLEKVGVDTGAGLERQLLVTTFPEDFKDKSIYDTDIFLNQMELLKEKAGNYDTKSARIIADHFRASVFLIANGITPSNVERGYVLRRLIRRMLRHLKQLEIKENIFDKLLSNLQNNFGEFYNEIMDIKLIMDVLNQEKIKFEVTLENGLKELNLIFQKADKNISGKEAFYIYETFGFPIELIKEEAGNVLFSVDEKEFEVEFNKHKEISKAGMEKKFGGHDLGSIDVNSESFKIRTRLHTATHLLLKALRTVLNDEVFQKGSDINDERLRFDFTFGRKMTDEELKQVEDLVNEKINQSLKVEFKEEKLEEALKDGYLGSFMAKYPEIVRVYNIGDWSKEICAGPHVENISELKGIKILKEEASSQGVRRIKAVLI